MQSDMQDVQTSSVMQLLKHNSRHIFEESHWSQFFFFAPNDKPMTLIATFKRQFMKLTPQNNSMLPFKESD
jgi:hypothetical protein